MDILELLTSQLGSSGALNQLGKAVGADPSKVQKAAQLGLPAILQALNRNASTAEGASSLARALDDHQNDDIDDIAGFFSKVDKNDGAKILNHVFADKNTKVQTNLAKQTGLDLNQIMSLMTQFAPLILGFLGQQKKKQGVDASGVAGLASSLLGSLNQSGGGNILGQVTRLLDSDGDGDIMDNIKKLLGSDALGNLGKSVGVSSNQAQQVAQLGLPAILQALSRNASTSTGAASLAKALDNHQDDGVDDLMGFFGKVDRNDGAKILSHVFADKNEKVQTRLAKQTGLDQSQVSGLLTQFAPLVLGMLGQQQKKQNLDADGVAGLTSALAGSMNQLGGEGIMDMASKLLDSDDDGNVMDDLGGLLGSFLKK